MALILIFVLKLLVLILSLFSAYVLERNMLGYWAGVGVGDFQSYNLVCSDIVVSKELHVNSEEYKQDQ